MRECVWRLLREAGGAVLGWRSMLFSSACLSGARTVLTAPPPHGPGQLWKQLSQIRDLDTPVSSWLFP